MRKNKLIALIGTLTLVGVGVASLGASKISENNEVAPVYAEEATVYLHTTYLWDQANAWFAIYGFHFANYVPTDNNSVLYFVNTKDWDSVKIHAWQGEFDTGKWENGPFMSKVEGLKYDNHDVYYYNTNKSINLSGEQMLIFHNGIGSQTGNISVSSGKTLCFHFSGPLKDLEGTGYGTKTENWSKMERVDYSGSDTSYFSGTYNTQDTLIFVRKNPADDTLSWTETGVWGQTYDLKGIPSGCNCYQIDGGNIDKPDGSWHFFNLHGDDKEYAFGDFGIKNPWSISSGVKMSTNGSNELKVTLPLKGKDELRFYVNNILDPYYDPNSRIVIKGDSPVKATIDTKTKNIVMPEGLEEGAYTIYWSYADSNWGCYIAKEVDTSRSLELYIMQYDTDGQCTTKFYSARTRYLAMTGEEQVAFKETEASVRYESWAAHLCENPWENAKAPSLVNFYTFSKDSANTWIIVVVAVVGVATVGVFFIYRKRKEN